MSAQVQKGGQREDAVWSLHILTAWGIPIRLHATFLLFLAWLGYMSMEGKEALQGALFLLGVFTCVVLHELGHALVARRFGIGTKDIVLYPIGGIATLKRSPKPHQELWIALAGPAVNVVLGLLLFLGVEITGQQTPIQNLSMGGGFWLEKLMVANFTLAVFNLIPAFPMDGGRVLRAALALKIGVYRATEIAASLGQGIAMLIGLFGLLYQPMLLFITVFVFLGASAEAAVYRSRALAEGVPVEEAMITNFVSLKPDDTLRDAAAVLLSGNQQDFPVVHGRELVGFMTREDLLRGLGKHGRSAYVTGIMRRDYPTTTPSSDLADLLTLMQEENAQSLPVVDHGNLVGLITAENIGEYFAVKAQTQRLRASGEVVE